MNYYDIQKEQENGRSVGDGVPFKGFEWGRKSIPGGGGYPIRYENDFTSPIQFNRLDLGPNLSI